MSARTESVAEHAAVTRQRPGRRWTTDLGERSALVGAWGAIVALFGALVPETFLTQANLATILGSQAVLLVVTLGLLIPLTAGDYDLSIAGTVTLTSMVVAVLNVNEGVALLGAVAAGLLVGLCVGLINGGIVVRFGIDPFVVTLGTGTILGGIALWISDSNSVSGVSEILVTATGGTRLLGIPLSFYYGLLLCLALWYVLEFTPVGRRLLFVGQGREVARLSGINVGRLRVGAMATSGLVSAAAGVLYAGTLGGADPSSGMSFLLPAYAAAFLGATAIVPGRFNPWGSFVAVYFLVTGITGLTLLGVAGFVQNLFYGGALVVAVVLSQLARRRSERRRAAAASTPDPT